MFLIGAKDLEWQFPTTAPNKRTTDPSPKEQAQDDRVVALCRRRAGGKVEKPTVENALTVMATAAPPHI
jgi:hypothetical protein